MHNLVFPSFLEVMEHFVNLNAESYLLRKKEIYTYNFSGSIVHELLWVFIIAHKRNINLPFTQ